nr:glycine cleavage T C-terminal barrel domain-containing protein [Blattabacterium sp. (Nauphoeta cinerea)]
MPRQGHLLIDENETTIGYVTSGGYSPVLKVSIGLGYLINKIKTNKIFVIIRKKKISIKTVKLPFVKIQN